MFYFKFAGLLTLGTMLLNMGLGWWSGRKPPPPPVITFQDRWIDSLASIAMMPMVTRVKTEKITVKEPDPEPEVAASVVEPPVVVRPRRVVVRDVCQRHGKKKVMVGKYRWRCR